jgi:hypothetical protein
MQLAQKLEREKLEDELCMKHVTEFLKRAGVGRIEQRHSPKQQCESVDGPEEPLPLCGWWSLCEGPWSL